MEDEICHIMSYNIILQISNAAEEYPDYLGQCVSQGENLGRLVDKLKKRGLYENTVIIFASDHGSRFKIYLFGICARHEWIPGAGGAGVC